MDIMDYSDKGILLYTLSYAGKPAAKRDRALSYAGKPTAKRDRASILTSHDLRLRQPREIGFRGSVALANKKAPPRLVGNVLTRKQDSRDFAGETSLLPKSKAVGTFDRM